LSVILSQFIDVTLLHFLTSYITLSCDANVTLKILRERVRVGEKREREKREERREKREERREKREERREKREERERVENPWCYVTSCFGQLHNTCIWR